MLNRTIHLIMEDVNEDRSLIPLIFDCRNLLLEFRRHKIIHAFCGENKVVD